MLPELTVKADGGDHAIQGHPGIDAVSVKVLNDHSIRIASIEDGKTVAVQTMTAAANGKTVDVAKRACTVRDGNRIDPRHLRIRNAPDSACTAIGIARVAVASSTGIDTPGVCPRSWRRNAHGVASAGKRSDIFRDRIPAATHEVLMMNTKATLGPETTRIGPGNVATAVTALLHRCTNRASDHRLARRRRAFERHPLTAPHQLTHLPSAGRAERLSTAECEREARSAEMAGRFAAAAAWWAAAVTAETASLTKAVEAGQWLSQAAYERYAKSGNQRVRIDTRHRREAEETADVITRQQAASGVGPARN